MISGGYRCLMINWRASKTTMRTMNPNCTLTILFTQAQLAFIFLSQIIPCDLIKHIRLFLGFLQKRIFFLVKILFSMSLKT